jgi:hypothetical protein
MSNIVNNISIINTTNTSIVTGSIGVTGSTGIGGSTGLTGSTGYQGFQITDWKEDMMKKYPRFTIKTEYDVMTFSPTSIIIDKTTNKEYKYKATNITYIVDETEQFIQSLVIILRDEKINNILIL